MVIPGILEIDFNRAYEKIKLVDSPGQYVQVDIADGNLVLGKTFLDIEPFNSLPIKSFIEIHLMVKNPGAYTNKKINTVKRMCAQVEADDVFSFIQKAKAMGYETGLALNPETPADEINPYLGDINYVQFMCVMPGAQGRKFDEGVLSKISDFKKQNPQIRIQADGGINENNIGQLLKAGVNDVVIGSAIFKL